MRGCVAWLLIVVAVGACSEAAVVPGGDAGRDAGPDAGPAAGGDAGADAGQPAVDAGACESPGPSPCDPLTQCGCSAAQMCDVEETGEPVCAARGTLTVGAECGDGEGQRCEPGTTCRRGVCHRICTIAEDECGGGGSRCELIVFGRPPWGSCSIPCTLVPQGGCADGQACVVAGQPGDITDCAASGSGTDGTPCGADPRTCAPGYQCSREMSRVCRRICRPGHPEDCAEPTPTCMVSPGFGVVGGTQYGQCV